MLSEPILSQRLVLRDITVADAQSVYDIWSNPENDKYMNDPIGSLEEVLSICAEKPEDSDYLKVITLKETNTLIGTCCFGETKAGNEWGFGYSIHKDYWGKGYATEIVKAIIAYGIEQGVKAFASDCAEENVASAKVMEKCGMTLAYKSSYKQPKLNVEYTSLIYKISMA